jgi:hypothetical protein
MQYKAGLTLSKEKVLFTESYRFERPRGRVNCQTRVRAPRARDAWRKNTEIYIDFHTLIFCRPEVQYKDMRDAGG